MREQFASMYVYTHAHTYIHTHTHARARASNLQACMQTCTCTYMHPRSHTHTHPPHTHTHPHTHTPPHPQSQHHVRALRGSPHRSIKESLLSMLQRDGAVFRCMNYGTSQTRWPSSSLKTVTWPVCAARIASSLHPPHPPSSARI